MPVVTSLRKVDVYAVPMPRNLKYFSKDWNLRWPLFRARIAVEEEADCLKVRILDIDSGELIAEAPFNGENGVRLCTDSSRHYALIARKDNVTAVLGVGFLDYNESFDFSLTLQAFSRRKAAEQRVDAAWASRMVASKEKSDTPNAVAPALAPPPGTKGRWSRFDSDSSSDEDFESKSLDTNTVEADDDEFGEFQ